MTIKSFLKSFFARFVSAHTTTYAASVAFYTALSLAPLLILFVTFTSQMSADFQQSFSFQIDSLVGSEAAKAVNLIINGAKDRTDLASLSGLFGFVTLLISASLIFGELREAMNTIFQTSKPADDSETIAHMVVHFMRDRVFQIGIAISFLFLMIVSLIFSSILSATFRSNESVWHAVDVCTSFGFYIFIFALEFRYVPTRRTPWRESLLGGVITALLFVIGKELIGLYIGKSALGSAYGAAGSVIVLLVWVYYSGLITFVGAHVSAILLDSKKEETES
ncbi:YihY/virulence factor BrkB family protein [soil metagenome]